MRWTSGKRILAVACLGAGITCTNAAPVQTTIENRKLSQANTNVFTADGTVFPLTLGWTTNLASASWCALEGAGACYFPGGAGVKVIREVRTNAWSQINSSGSTNLIARNYLTLWLDHGIRPSNTAYAYVCLPNFTAAQAAAYASNPPLTVLENSSNAQAVKETGANIVAANFWADATKTIDFITVDKPASVMTQESETDLAVAISDPTQTNSGSVTITLNRSAVGVARADAGITVTQVRPTIQFTVNVKNSFGRSFSARFNYLNSPPTLAPVSDQIASAGVPLMLTNVASDPDLPFQSLAFSLLAGPTNAVINSTNGVLTWRPALFQAGTTNVFSIRVSDNGTSSLSSTGAFKVTVNPVAQPIVRLTISSNHQATLNITGDFGPGYLVLASTNLVNWTTIYASNSPVLPLIWTDAQSGLFARRFYRVLLGPATPTLAPLPNVAGNAGASLLVTNAASDLNLPPLSLSFRLLAGPAGASINSTNGVISWRPSVAQANTTNQFVVEVANSGVPSLISTQSFSAVVNPVSPPSAAVTLSPGGTPRLRVSGSIGPDYSILASTNLVNWDPVFSTNSPVTPFVWTDSQSALFKRRFYRVAIGP